MARGSVKKRGKTWYYTVDVGEDHEGKRKQKRKGGFQSKPEAEKALTELLNQLDKGIYIETKKQTVSEYLDYWLEKYGEIKLAPRTYESYEMIINKHLKPILGRIPLEKLKPLHLQEYYVMAQKSGRKDGKGEGLSPTTVLYHHRIIHRALNRAVRWGFIYRNVADAVDPPSKNKNEMKIISETDVKKLLDKVKGTYLYMPVFIGITTGMRAGEILGLRWSDVDLKTGLISVVQELQLTKKEGIIFREPKTTGSKRTIELSPLVTNVLKQHKVQLNKERLAAGENYKDKDLVCCLQDGTPLNPGTISSRFHINVTELGFGIRFHDLRHSHASILLQQGVNPKVVSERLGHAKTSMTMDVYSHVLPGMQREAACMLDQILFG